VDDASGGKIEKMESRKSKREGILAHCTFCGCERVFLRHHVRHARHFFGTILSLGLWLVPWLAICIEGALRPWRCEACGWHKPEFRVPLHEALQMGEAALHGSRRQTAIRMIERDYAASARIPTKET
jgi:hypothetical protein